VTTRVRLADLAPTLLEAAGLSPPNTMGGQSLLPLIGSRSAADRPVYAETDYPRQAFGWSPLVAWYADRFWYVRSPRPELYDMVNDAGATRNIAATRMRVVDGMNDELAAFVRSTTGSAAPSRGARTADPALTERLAALGYVSGSGAGASGSPGGPGGIDPKDRIAIANDLHTAVVAVEDGRFQRAVPLLEQVVAVQPDIPIAQLNLGIAWARQRQFAKALGSLRKAVALQPDHMLARYELGVALYETGDLPGAAREFEVATTRMPRWADAQYSLASVYARIDRVAEAVVRLRTTLGLESKHFRANLLLGRILTLQGDARAALPYAQAAVAAQPSSSEAHEFLADALDRVGSAGEAAGERERAAALKKKG
jgi:Flp pilus assembly protein TadD